MGKNKKKKEQLRKKDNSKNSFCLESIFGNKRDNKYASFELNSKEENKYHIQNPLSNNNKNNFKTMIHGVKMVQPSKHSLNNFNLDHHPQVNLDTINKNNSLDNFISLNEIIDVSSSPLNIAHESQPYQFWEADNLKWQQEKGESNFEQKFSAPGVKLKWH